MKLGKLDHVPMSVFSAIKVRVREEPSELAFRSHESVVVIKEEVEVLAHSEDSINAVHLIYHC